MRLVVGHIGLRGLTVGRFFSFCCSRNKKLRKEGKDKENDVD
jgi:hypothetical protein